MQQQPGRTPAPPHLKDGPGPGSPEAAALDATWRDPPGLLGWLAAVNHKAIARRFIITTFGFFVAGGLLAFVMYLAGVLANATVRPPTEAPTAAEMAALRSALDKAGLLKR